MNRRIFIETVTGIAAATRLSHGSVFNPKPVSAIRHEFKGYEAVVADGLKTDNDHIYPISSWESAIEKAKSQRLFCTTRFEGSRLDLTSVAARVTSLEVRHVDGTYEVVATFDFVKTPDGERMKYLVDEGAAVYLTPAGEGVLGSDGVISHYSTDCLVFANNSASKMATVVTRRGTA